MKQYTPSRRPSGRGQGRIPRTVVWLVACAATARATDGLEPIAVSASAAARGGASVAVGDSALSQIDNPATLTMWRRPRMDFSGQLLRAHQEWSSPVGASASDSAHPLVNIAFALPANERLTFGLAMQSKCGVGSHFEMRHVLIPFMKRHVASDCKDVAFSFNAGYRLTERLSVGAGVRMEVATARFNTVLGPADASFDRGYAYGGGFNVGALYQMTERLALGVGYRSPTWFTDVSGGEMRAALFGLAPVSMGAARILDFRLPQRISVGAAWDVTEWLKLVGEARWNNYANTTFGRARISADALGPLVMPLPLDYRDQWVFIGGAEFKLSESWRLGVGYNYATAIVRQSNLLPIMAPTVQHHVTAGVRYERANWWVGVSYVLGLAPGVEGSGMSRLPLGVDYGESRLTQHQHSVLLGFGFSL